MALIASDGRLNRAHWFLPALALALIGAALDVAQWTRAIPLWVDEEMIAINLRDRGLLELPGALWLAQSAPLAWLAAQRLVVVTLGTGEMTLRLVPLLFGMATLGAAVWIGRRWFHPLSASLLVVICALAQWLSHYRFEVKHYSADAFWALLLPALAAWAIEDDEEGDARASTEWRWTRWWAIAALAQWTAHGAFLVTPGCAAVAFAVILRRQGSAAAVRFATTGTLWLVSLGTHYVLSLQYAHHSHFLQNYWSAHLVPASLGLVEGVIWLGGRLEALGSNPGGAPVGVALWVAAFCGFAASPRRRLAGMFVTVPIAGFALAALRLVPLSDRLALWIIPSLYVGVVLLFDRGVRLLANGQRRSLWIRVIGGAATCAGLYVARDVALNGYRQLDLGVPVHGNRGVDDRMAVRWLMERRQPGDAIVSTRLGWPALWWYGGIPLSPPSPGGRLRDGSVMYEASHERGAPGCEKSLQGALVSHRRMLVHVGFPDMPEGFYDLIIRQLSTVGTVVEEARFPYLSRVAVVEVPGSTPDSIAAPSADTLPVPPELAGCVTASIARRW